MNYKCVSKYVYRPNLKNFYSYERRTWLHDDFPQIQIMFSEFQVRRVEVKGKIHFKAWRDKHFNVVVRVFHLDTQTNLNL